jgi:hypothetical protein
MGKETVTGDEVPDDMYGGSVGEYPAGIDNIVGTRIEPAPGVKNDESFQEAVQSGRIRTLLSDLLRRGIHSKTVLEKPNQITIFTSRNKGALTTIALTAAAVGTAYALRKKRQRKT